MPHFSENVWMYVLGAVNLAILSPVIARWLARTLPSRGETAKAKVDEVTADATAAGAWQTLYVELKHRVDGLEIEVASLRESLNEANDRVKVQALLLRSVCRWALLLKDELLRVGGDVPPMPPEVEDAITNLGP
jgi:hypothetical protein